MLLFALVHHMAILDQGIPNPLMGFPSARETLSRGSNRTHLIYV